MSRQYANDDAGALGPDDLVRLHDAAVDRHRFAAHEPPDVGPFHAERRRPRRIDAPRPGLRLEPEAGGEHAVRERPGLDGERVGLVHDGVLEALRELDVLDLERQPIVLESGQRAEDLAQPCRPDDGERVGPLQQRHRRDHAGQAVEVVAVEVGDEDGLDAGALDARAEELELRALAAVEEEDAAGAAERARRRGGGRASGSRCRSRAG